MILIMTNEKKNFVSFLFFQKVTINSILLITTGIMITLIILITMDILMMIIVLMIILITDSERVWKEDLWGPRRCSL